MRSVTIVNRTRESVLGTKVGLADRWWLRARGFLRRPEPREGEGLLLNPCRAVHMVGMAFPLDIVFVDRHGRVLALYAELQPGRRSRWHGGAKYAIELPAGTIEATRTEAGDLVAWHESGPRADPPPPKEAESVVSAAPASPATGAVETTETRRDDP
jgi:hypothetical protein